MPARPLSDFLPEVLPDVRDCPPMVARNAIRNAIIDFCVGSLIYRPELELVSIEANEPNYELDLPPETVIHLPVSVKYDGEPIDPVTQEELDADKDEWETETGDPTNYFMYDFRTLRLYPIPPSALTDGLRVRAALKPSRAARNVDELFFEDYLEEIARGAKAKLFAMKDKAWTSASKAADMLEMFKADIGGASARAARGMLEKPLRTKAIYSLG